MYGQLDDMQLLGLQGVEVEVAAAGYSQEDSGIKQVDSGSRKVTRTCLEE
jgi:hypothetical protein